MKWLIVFLLIPAASAMTLTPQMDEIVVAHDGFATPVLMDLRIECAEIALRAPPLDVGVHFEYSLPEGMVAGGPSTHLVPPCDGGRIVHEETLEFSFGLAEMSPGLMQLPIQIDAWLEEHPANSARAQANLTATVNFAPVVIASSAPTGGRAPWVVPVVFENLGNAPALLTFNVPTSAGVSINTPWPALVPSAIVNGESTTTVEFVVSKGPTQWTTIPIVATVTSENKQYSAHPVAFNVHVREDVNQQAPNLGLPASLLALGLIVARRRA